MFTRAVRPKSRLGQKLERLSHGVTAWTGSSWAFAIALAIIIVWVITGPVFHFSDTWQLVINTGTTIVTFLMVFLIQRTQNKDSLAIQLKLNEIVAAIDGASNRLIDVEDLSEAELRIIHTHYQELSEMAAKEQRITNTHSIDEAKVRHEMKEERRKHRRVK